MVSSMPSHKHDRYELGGQFNEVIHANEVTVVEDLVPRIFYWAREDAPENRGNWSMGCVLNKRFHVAGQ